MWQLISFWGVKTYFGKKKDYFVIEILTLWSTQKMIQISWRYTLQTMVYKDKDYYIREPYW